MKDKRTFAVLATDVCIFTVKDGELMVLLTPVTSKSFRGILGLPGGLVGVNELTTDAARRITKNVLTKSDFYMEQLFTFDNPERDPLGRVVSVAYLMLVPSDQFSKVTKDGATWKPVKNLLNLAYDHNDIVKSAVKRLKGKISYTNIVFALISNEFTLSELQDTYEAILEKSMDKRNFRKKINGLHILTKLAGKKKSGAHRPASVYKFKEKSLAHINII